jgi:hypothetical protein
MAIQINVDASFLTRLDPDLIIVVDEDAFQRCIGWSLLCFSTVSAPTYWYIIRLNPRMECINKKLNLKNVRIPKNET